MPGGVALRVGHQVDDHPLEQTGVDHDVGQLLRQVQHDGPGFDAEVVERPGDDVLHGHRPGADRQRAGLQSAEVQQVLDQCGQPVEGVVGGLEELAAVVVAEGRPRGCGARRPPLSRSASGVRRSWPTAASRAVRSRLPASSSAASRTAEALRAARSTTQLTMSATTAKTTTATTSLASWIRKVWNGSVKKKLSSTDAERAREQGGPQAADDGGGDDQQQEQQRIAGQVEAAAQRDQHRRRARRRRGRPAGSRSLAAERSGCRGPSLLQTGRRRCVGHVPFCLLAATSRQRSSRVPPSQAGGGRRDDEDHQAEQIRRRQR